MPNVPISNEDMLLSVGDSLVVKKLEEIQDTLSYVIGNTQPISDFDKYIFLFEGKIALVALVISVIAAFISFFCFYYQRRSANLLQIANQRKPNLYPIARKLYENSITLQVIFEFDSDYTMSYTAERKTSKEKRSSNNKHYFYDIYPSENLLCQMKLPEDLIMLEKYEIYANDDIYNMAFIMMDNIAKYNESIERAIMHIQNNSSDSKIKKDRDDLWSYSRKLLRMMFDLDELVWKEEKPKIMFWHKHRLNRQLEHDILLFVAARFLAKMKNVTSDIIIADPFFKLTGNVIDSPNSLVIAELQLRHEIISKERKKKSFDSEETIDKYLKNAITCVYLINTRERDNTEISSFSPKEQEEKRRNRLLHFTRTSDIKKDKDNLIIKSQIITNLDSASSSSLYQFFLILRKRILSFFKLQESSDVTVTPFKDLPLRRNIENILGAFNSSKLSIYDKILEQLDQGVLDMEQIIRYDTTLQIFAKKHDLLSENSAHAFNKEKRRIDRKIILMNKQKKQSNKESDNQITTH